MLTSYWSVRRDGRRVSGSIAPADPLLASIRNATWMRARRKGGVMWLDVVEHVSVPVSDQLELALGAA